MDYYWEAETRNRNILTTNGMGCKVISTHRTTNKACGNLDLHRTLPIQAKLKRFVENPDGSVKYYLNQNDSRKKDSGATALIDSTDGNVMLEKPEYYFKLEQRERNGFVPIPNIRCPALSRWNERR